MATKLMGGIGFVLPSGARLIPITEVSMLDSSKARISVKLVSKAGVGTIATGVTKAKADVVLIDLEEPWIVSKELIVSRSKNTPFEDARFSRSGAYVTFKLKFDQTSFAGLGL